MSSGIRLAADTLAIDGEHVLFHVVVVLPSDAYLRIRASAFLVVLFDVLAPDELNAL